MFENYKIKFYSKLFQIYSKFNPDNIPVRKIQCLFLFYL